MYFFIFIMSNGFEEFVKLVDVVGKQGLESLLNGDLGRKCLSFVVVVCNFLFYESMRVVYRVVFSKDVGSVIGCFVWRMYWYYDKEVMFKCFGLLYVLLY